DVGVRVGALVERPHVELDERPDPEKLGRVVVASDADTEPLDARVVRRAGARFDGEGSVAETGDEPGIEPHALDQVVADERPDGVSRARAAVFGSWPVAAIGVLPVPKVLAPDANNDGTADAVA